MRILDKFQQFVKKGIVRKRSPDFLRARFLVRESEKRKEYLEKVLKAVPVSDLGANYISEQVYDIIRELINAELLIKGFDSRKSHEATVSYMRVLGFGEDDVIFMNELRYLRNGIKYYGKLLTAEYAERALSFLNKIYDKLKKIVNEVI